jgi:hypothetical protein
MILDLDKMMAGALAAARSNLFTNGPDDVLVPVCLCYSAAGTLVIPLQGSKSAFLQVLPSILREARADGYVIIAEAWFATGDRDDIDNGPMPSQRDDRQECLTIYAERRGESRLKRWLLLRGEAGKVVGLSELRDPSPGWTGWNMWAGLLDERRH